MTYVIRPLHLYCVFAVFVCGPDLNNAHYIYARFAIAPSLILSSLNKNI